MKKKPSIVCFGEVLWDMLPSGKIAGGAPMNVAYHANSLGLKAKMISAVGQDELGKELIAFLEKKNIKTDLIETNADFPTSTVQVALNKRGSATYEIVKAVAWDYIHADKKREKAVEQADLLLFGSLVCREECSKNALFQLIEKAKKTVFDVNLRAPFYGQTLLESLLHKANIVKMNDEELDIITAWYGVKYNQAAQMRLVMEKFGVEVLVVTKGKHGAMCMTQTELIEQESFSVKVADTIGAGDAFLAAFLTKMLDKKSWKECLEFACATGALVASKSGGTPEIDEEMVLAFIQLARGRFL